MNWAEQQKQFDIIAVEGAILIEANTYKLFDELWVVTLPKEEAKKRVRIRNPELTETQIDSLLSRQISDEERLKYATFSYTTHNTSYEENCVSIEGRLAKVRDKLKQDSKKYV